MAQNYRVCNGTNRTNVTITSSLGTFSSRTYTQGECTITEEVAIMTLTANAAVDTDYSVWYKYMSKTKTNYVWSTPYLVIMETLMPANATTIAFEVVTERTFECQGSSGNSY